MSSRALDTNVLLRYLTADDPEQSPIAGRLIDQPKENSDDFLVTIPVVCELTWLLRSRRYLAPTRRCSFCTMASSS